MASESKPLEATIPFNILTIILASHARSDRHDDQQYRICFISWIHSELFREDQFIEEYKNVILKDNIKKVKNQVETSINLN